MFFLNKTIPKQFTFTLYTTVSHSVLIAGGGWG